MWSRWDKPTDTTRRLPSTDASCVDMCRAHRHDHPPSQSTSPRPLACIGQSQAPTTGQISTVEGLGREKNHKSPLDFVPPPPPLLPPKGIHPSPPTTNITTTHRRTTRLPRKLVRTSVPLTMSRYGLPNSLSIPFLPFLPPPPPFAKLDNNDA